MSSQIDNHMLAYDEEDYFEIYGCTGACEEDFDEDAEMDKQDENEED